MSLQVNGNANAVNWEALLSKVGDVQKTAGADGVGGATQFTVTTSVDGVATPVTILIPDDLEIPDEVDQAAIDSLCEKLAADTGLNLSKEQIAQIHDALMGALAEVGGASGLSQAASSKTVMFDLYKLLALLVEVAQKQRDASRELRQAENQAIQKSILDQASAQRLAAVTGMIGGALCCLVQVGFTLFSMARQSGAFKEQLGSSGTHGIDSAKQNLDMAKAAGTAAGAQAQLNKIEASVGSKPGTAPGHTVKQEVLADGFDTATRATIKLEAAKIKLNADTRELQACQLLSGNNGENVRAADLPAGPVKDALGKLETFQQKLQEGGITAAEADEYIQLSRQAAEGKLSQAQRVDLLNRATAKPVLKEIGNQTSTELKAAVQSTATARAETLRAEVQADQAALETASANVRDAYAKDLQRFEDEYDNARRDVANINKDTPPAQAKELRARLQTATDRLTYARAHAYNELAKPDIYSAASHATLVKSAGQKIDAAVSDRNLDTRYIKATYALQRGEARISLINAIGNALQSMISHAAQYMQAEATKQGAAQQQQQEELDQAKDLFNQAEELVNSVVQLMQAIGSAETQSMRDAIQA